MDVGEGRVAGTNARWQQRRHLLDLGALADEDHALAHGSPAVRKVEEYGRLAAAHQSKAVRTVVEDVVVRIEKDAQQEIVLGDAHCIGLPALGVAFYQQTSVHSMMARTYAQGPSQGSAAGALERRAGCGGLPALARPA